MTKRFSRSGGECRGDVCACCGKAMPSTRRTARHALTLALEAGAIGVVPVALVACAVCGIDQAALLSMLVVVASLALFFVGFEASAPRLRDVMPIAVLAALAAAGRILFALTPSVKPVSAIAVIAGAAFGRRGGFAVGALAALVSNFFFGQGPWSPWQMYGWGLVGYMGGILASVGAFGGGAFGKEVFGTESGRSQSLRPLASLAAFGLFSGYLYGLVQNVWSVMGFFHPESIQQVLAVYAAALPFDTVHGVSTALFLLALYRPWLRKLQRVKRKYGLRD